MRIGADQRIGERDPRAVLFLSKNDAREIFEIYLVAYPCIGRNYFEIPKTFLAPAQECVTLDVALHLQISVERERSRRAEFIHLHGVVYHEISRKQRIDFL